MNDGQAKRHCPHCGEFYAAELLKCPRDNADLGAPDLRVGQVVDHRYTLLEPLASERYGQVFRARQAGVNRDVALKIVARDLIGDEKVVEAFRREAQAAGRLNHPLILGLLDFGISEGQVYIATELLLGSTLADTIRVQAPVAMSRMLYIVSQVADALEAAHAVGVVHRNLHPSKIPVVESASRPDTVKVRGFGLGVGKAELGGAESSSSTHYVAPEQHRGQPGDIAADVYALGAIAYELLSGAPPFSEVHDPKERLEAQLNAPPAPLPEVYSATVREAVMTALDKDPAKRPPGPGFFKRALQDALSPIPRASSSEVASSTEPLGESITPERDLWAQETGSFVAVDKIPLEDSVGWGDVTGSLMKVDIGTDLEHVPEVMTPVVDSSTDLIGRTLDGRYRLIELIGAGGFGQVFRAKQVPLDRDVAIKVIAKSVIHDEGVAARFAREAQVSGQLQHPHVVGALAFGATSDGLWYLVMEYVEGETLKDVLLRERRFQVSRCLSIAAQICEALEAAHRNDIVHRDLKPSNVMLVAHSGRVDFVKVLDFGLARSLSEENSSARPSAMFGSPAYMSPEMILKRTADARGDLYALGIMMYEMVAGAPPYPDVQNLFDLMRAHAYSQPAPLPSHVPGPLQAVIRRLLSKDPDQRYSSATELRLALANCPTSNSAAQSSPLPSLGDLPDGELVATSDLTEAVGVVGATDSPQDNDPTVLRRPVESPISRKPSATLEDTLPADPPSNRTSIPDTKLPALVEDPSSVRLEPAVDPSEAIADDESEPTGRNLEDELPDDDDGLVRVVTAEELSPPQAAPKSGVSLTTVVLLMLLMFALGAVLTQVIQLNN